VRPARLVDIAITEVPFENESEASGWSGRGAPAIAAPSDAEHAALSDSGINDPLTGLSDGGKPESERERLIWAMERCGWVQAKAARLLGITPRQMGYALQKHGIEVRKF